VWGPTADPKTALVVIIMAVVFIIAVIIGFVRKQQTPENERASSESGS
jgi:hypothetical protein